MLKNYLYSDDTKKPFKFENEYSKTVTKRWDSKDKGKLMIKIGSIGSTQGNKNNEVARTPMNVPKKLYGNHYTREVTDHKDAQSKYLKDQMHMLDKIKKSEFKS